MDHGRGFLHDFATQSALHAVTAARDGCGAVQSCINGFPGNLNTALRDCIST